MAVKIKTALELNRKLEEMEQKMAEMTRNFCAEHALARVIVLDKEDGHKVIGDYYVTRGVENGDLCYGSEDPNKSYNNLMFEVMTGSDQVLMRVESPAYVTELPTHSAFTYKNLQIITIWMG